MGTLRQLRNVYKSAFGSYDARISARHHLATAVCARLGFRIYGSFQSWHIDPECLKQWKRFPGGSKTYSDRRYNLFKLAQSVTDVPGDTVECGAFRGASSHMILAATEGVGKMHHIFDSFSGLSNAIAEDRKIPEGHYEWQAGDLTASEDVVRRNLSQFGERVIYYRGWIPDHFPEVRDRRFALVHVDVDLYEPTRDSVSFFYDRLSPGGILVCDDYGSMICPGARKAMDEFFNSKPEHIVHISTGQAIVWKR